uniref:uncharacterized protein n=1 Tax=Semicossyphus pulcher TaxID=241346 RepID=UPI0037E88952
MVGDIHTHKSLPFEINVDGGWAILKAPAHPNFVGDTLELTCRVRGEPQLHEVILYNNGVEVMRRVGANPTFNLPNLTVEYRGMYSCRASWDVDRRTRSVISAEAPVQVIEVLSEPILEIVADNNLIPANKMKLICHLQYNAPAPAPPVNYYFYKGDNRLGTATSVNHDVVKRMPGQYRCKAKVPQLGLSRLSKPKSFGQVSGPQMMMPPVLHPRDPRPLAPPISSPDSSLRPAAEPTTAGPSSKRSTATSTFIQPTDVSTQSSDPLLMPSQPALSTLLPTPQPIKKTAFPEPVNVYEVSGEMSGDSGDMPEEFGDMSGDKPKLVDKALF